MFRNVAHEKSSQITSAFKQVLLGMELSTGSDPWSYRKDGQTLGLTGWFGTFFLLFHMYIILIPTDFLIFQRGCSTTNQRMIMDDPSHMGVSIVMGYPKKIDG